MSTSLARSLDVDVIVGEKFEHQDVYKFGQIIRC